MGIGDLVPVVVTIVMVGMLLGIGVLVYDKIGSSSSAWIDRPESNGTYVSVNKSTVTLPNTNILAFTASNSSTKASIIAATEYTLYNTNGTFIIINNQTSCRDGNTCFYWYTWRDKNTSTTRTFTDLSGALGDISENWISLLVTIVILAIILTMVIRSFSMRR